MYDKLLIVAQETVFQNQYSAYEIAEAIDKKYGQSRAFIEEAKSIIRDKLTENKISFILEGRVKSVYSLYRKMYTLNKSFDEIYDFYAVRIIVETELECYTALGLVHEHFKSIPPIHRCLIDKKVALCYNKSKRSSINIWGKCYGTRIV